MEVSLVIPVLNSHEVVRRQILHWERMDIPSGVEIILMDDGSDPPLEFDTEVVAIHKTNETRPWTNIIARNRGAAIATGRNLFITDIDYIVSQKAFMDAVQFTGHRMRANREFGVLDENGVFTQDKETLFSYGLSPEYYAKRKGRMPPHLNSYVMDREVFFDIGGYDEDAIIKRSYPQGEDTGFEKRCRRWEVANNVMESEYRPVLYMFPSGQFCGDVDYNPFGLFHDLTRKTEKNVFHARIERRKQREKT